MLPHAEFQRTELHASAARDPDAPAVTPAGRHPYGPKLSGPGGSENGSGLSEAVSELMEGLKKADEEKLITAVSASSIEFDSDTNTVFRKVDVHIEFCLCEEG